MLGQCINSSEAQFVREGLGKLEERSLAPCSVLRDTSTCLHGLENHVEITKRM